jgi:hypothetical protein
LSDSLVQEIRIAQVASVDQQREVMRWMTGLNEWLERETHDRQSELRSLSARMDYLNDQFRTSNISSCSMLQLTIMIPPLKQTSNPVLISLLQDPQPIFLGKGLGEVQSHREAFLLTILPSSQR